MFINNRVGFPDLYDSKPESEVEHFRVKLFDKDQCGGVDAVNPEHVFKVVFDDHFSFFYYDSFAVVPCIKVYNNFKQKHYHGSKVKKPEF